MKSSNNVHNLSMSNTIATKCRDIKIEKGVTNLHGYKSAATTYIRVTLTCYLNSDYIWKFVSKVLAFKIIYGFGNKSGKR